MRVSVAVVPAERRHRDRRAHGVEEPLRIGRPAVVGNLEDLGTQPAGLAQQRLLSQRVAVAGEQHAAVGTGDAQHHRAAVARRVLRHPPRRREHLDGARAQREPHAGVHADDRDPAGPGDSDGFDRTGGQRVRSAADAGGDQQRSHVHAPQHLGEAAGVVVVPVGQHDSVERADATRRQFSGQHARVGSRIDDHARAVAPAGRLDEQAVALTDIEHRELQCAGRGRWQAQQHDGSGHRHRGDARDGRAAQTQDDAEQRRAQHGDQVAGRQCR